MRLVWTRKASNQLDSIFEYISLDSPVYALRFIEKIIERAELVANQPNSGRIVPELKRSDIREVFVHPYRIIYLVEDSSIEILSIIHGARLLPNKVD